MDLNKIAGIISIIISIVMFLVLGEIFYGILFLVIGLSSLLIKKKPKVNSEL